MPNDTLSIVTSANSFKEDLDESKLFITKCIENHTQPLMGRTFPSASQPIT